MLSVTFKVKFMFQLAILYIIFNTATLNLNKITKDKKKKKKQKLVVVAAFKEICFRHCPGCAIFLKKLTLFYH